MRLLLLVPVLACANPLFAQDDLLHSASRWTISPNGGSFAEEDGERILQLTGGSAALGDLLFESGTITFDVRLTPQPAFVGLRFRTRDRDGEHVYFRPHRSGFWDAIQYQPVMNGSTTWQLYQVEGFSQAVELPATQWLPVRLEVRGAWAELYVGSATEPTMRMPLEHGVTAGGLAFTAGFRDGNPDRATAGAFRRLRVRHRPPAGDAHDDGAEPSDDLIRTWTVSDPIPVDALPITAIPPVSGSARRVEAERHGVVNLNRYYAKVPGADRSAVTAQVTIDAPRAMRVPLAFDFSDDVSVFLGEDLLFSGSNGWQSRYPYYLGGLRPDALTNTVWLPLRGGSNHLTLVVSDEAFGWGFVARLGESDGLRVQVP